MSSPARRRPWLAGLLAVVSPGLGHVYSGNPKLGVVLSVGRWLPLIVTLTLGTLLDWNLYTCLLAVIPYFAIYVAQIPWAVIAARKADEDYTLRWFNRASFYLGYALTMMVLSFSAALTTRARVVEAFKIPAGSMRPSIVPGDQVFVVKIGPLVSSYAPGDLIIFRHPESGATYIKRVVARGGDSVEVSSGVVSVNGRPLGYRRCETMQLDYVEMEVNGPVTLSADCYVESMSNGHSYKTLRSIDPDDGARDYGPETIPDHHFFVLGDNRDNSWDSRFWGFVPVEGVIGKPAVIWWSEDPTDGSLRLDRLGQRP